MDIPVYDAVENVRATVNYYGRSNEVKLLQP